MKKYAAIIFKCVPNTPHLYYINTHYNVCGESNKDNSELRFINKTIEHYEENKMTDDIFGAIGRLEGDSNDAYVCFVSESIETLMHIKSKAHNSFDFNDNGYSTMAFFLSQNIDNSETSYFRFMNRENVARFMEYFTPINVITVTKDGSHIDRVRLVNKTLANILTHCIGDFNKLLLYPKMDFISSVSDTTEGCKYVVVTNINESLDVLIRVLHSIMSNEHIVEENYFIMLNDNVRTFIRMLERDGGINERIK